MASEPKKKRGRLISDTTIPNAKGNYLGPRIDPVKTTRDFSPPRGQQAQQHLEVAQGYVKGKKDKKDQRDARQQQKQEARDATGSAYMLASMYKVILLGILYLLTTGQFVAPPRTVILRFISWYQRNISAGRNLCPRGAGQNCSTLGYQAVEKFGALRGALAVIRIIAECKRLAAMSESDDECSCFCGGGNSD